MGSSLSALTVYSVGSPPSSKPGLGDLPEGCVALVLNHLDPPEICKLARLNRAFRGASSADFVWESKLPSDYRFLIEKLFGGFPENLVKKEIYARLCRPNSFDGGTKKAWLDKTTGGVCLSIAAKGLAITGIDDRRYWNHIPTEESRLADQVPVFGAFPCRNSPKFHTVAYLQQIWWLEVDGEVEFPLPAGTYSLFFRLQLGRASKWLGRRVCNSEHVHGWDVKPVRFQLWTSDGQHVTSQCFLDEPGKWIRYHVGNFVVENAKPSTKIKFSMTQIDCTHTKGGLCLDSVLIYPSEYRERLKHF
ncbi:hypothetical protein L1049_006016 [Liquidambar formosana]|uniref:F-box domain-containing protein n=1 Tax=Liquidambar formosana TaxID=63359 RepID=A0AAP0RGD2_LIQFO